MKRQTGLMRAPASVEYQIHQILNSLGLEPGSPLTFLQPHGDSVIAGNPCGGVSVESLFLAAGRPQFYAWQMRMCSKMQKSRYVTCLYWISWPPIQPSDQHRQAAISLHVSYLVGIKRGQRSFEPKVNGPEICQDLSPKLS